MSMVSQQNQAGISLGEIDRVVAGIHHDPHSILGAHPGPDGVVVRVLRPLAKSVTVVLPDGQRFPAEHVHEGVFAATLPAGQTARLPGRGQLPRRQRRQPARDHRRRPVPVPAQAWARWTCT